MKYNPWGLAVALVVAIAAIASIPKVKKVKPYRFNWGLILLMAAVIVLLVWDAKVRAADIQYCVSMDKGNKVVMQCQNGTVTVVDNINDKVVVCSAGHNDTPRCQTLPLKDDK